MNIVVCVKYVPDATADRKFEDDFTVDRVGVDVAQLLAFAVKNNASDLHLSAGVPPMIRVDGVGKIEFDFAAIAVLSERTTEPAPRANDPARRK